MRPVINTQKHIVQLSLFAVASGAISTQTIALAAQDPTETSATAIREGSKISAVYCEMWITSDDAAAGTAIVTLERRPGGVGAMNTTDSAALDGYDNKKNILYTFMGLIGPNVQVPTPAIRAWFKIPKGKQRFGIGDRLMLNIHGQSNGVSACGFFIFKEQY